MSKSPVARSSAVIAVVGEALVDLVVAGDDTITATPGGAPFNVARACARLGMPVSLIAAVSTDRFGQRLTAALAADGVDDAYVQRREQPTTLRLGRPRSLRRSDLLLLPRRHERPDIVGD